MYLIIKSKIKNLTTNSYNLKANSGFTLIESLIYVALIGLVVSGFISFSLSISDLRNKNYVTQEVQANARTALNLITQKILSANSVNIGSSIFGSDPGELSLSMTNESKNPTIINLNVDNGILQITEGLSSAVAVTSNKVKITNLVFANLTSTGEKENIRIQMTVEYNNAEGDIKYNYSQTIQTAISLRQ